MELFFDPEIWAAFVTLTLLEIVLGIDNLILISILTDKLPEHQKPLARKLGLVAALLTRLLLLSLVFWMAHLEKTLFIVFDHEISWRDIMLMIGGLFLLAKGTLEIHDKIEGENQAETTGSKQAAFMAVIVQISIMDIVFSFDSVMTAIGIADHLPVMISAILISVAIMVLAVDQVSQFISNHPTVKVLALSYMLLIGFALIGEGLEMQIPKGYLYFAMAFSSFVEAINMAVRKRM